MRLRLAEAVEAVSAECPAAAAASARALGVLVLRVDAPGEAFGVAGGTTLRVIGAPAAADVRIVTTGDAVLDLLDGRVELVDAVLGEVITVVGDASALARCYDALVLFVGGAARAPTCEGVLRRFRRSVEGGRDEA